MTAAGARALLRSLRRGPLRHLTALNLEANEVSPALLDRIEHELARHCQVSREERRI